MDEFRFTNPRRRKSDDSQGIPTLTQVVSHSVLPELSRMPDIRKQNLSSFNNQTNTGLVNNNISNLRDENRPRYEGRSALTNEQINETNRTRNDNLSTFSNSTLNSRSNFTNNPPPRRSALHDNIAPNSVIQPNNLNNNSRFTNHQGQNSQFAPAHLVNQQNSQFPSQPIANNANSANFQRVSNANNSTINPNSAFDLHLMNNQVSIPSQREQQILDKINQAQSKEMLNQPYQERENSSNYARPAANFSPNNIRQQNVDSLNTSSRTNLPNDWQNINEAINKQMPSMPQANNEANLSPRVRQLMNNANDNYQQLAKPNFNQPNSEAANRVSSILNQKPNPSSIQPVIRHVNNEDPQDLRPRNNLISRFSDRFDNLGNSPRVESTSVTSPQVEAATLNVLSAELSYAISKHLTSDLPKILESSFKKVIQSLENEIREGINISTQNAIREFLEERDRVARNK